MPEDRVRELFEQVAQLDVSVPASERVVARGQRRQRRVALSLSAGAAVLIVAFGLGASQLTRGASSVRVAEGVLAAPDAHRAMAGGTGSGSRHGPDDETAPPAGALGGLPPAGTGPLLLALTTHSQFVMTRVGSAREPVPVRGLHPAANGASQVATNPAGGWVVIFASDEHAPSGTQPARLALLSATGRREPFGPVFLRESVSSLAVSPDGNRVAVALFRPTGGGPARIEVLAMPGYHVRSRTWTIPLAEANFATSLSWEPDARHLSYIAGEQTGAGIAGAPATLDTAAPGSLAPGPAVGHYNGKAGCQPDAGAWLGTSGRFAALEECSGDSVAKAKIVFQLADPTSGSPTGQPTVITRQAGCGSGALDPSPDGHRILISYCGSWAFIDNGKLERLSGSFLAAALAG